MTFKPDRAFEIPHMVLACPNVSVGDDDDDDDNNNDGDDDCQEARVV